MVPNYQNYMDVNIGGQPRKLKVGMWTAKRVADWYMSDPESTYNPMDRQLKMLYFGLDYPENNVPEGFNEMVVAEWIDDMEQEEYEKMRAFAMQALGFIVATIDKEAERMFGQVESL